MEVTDLKELRQRVLDCEKLYIYGAGMIGRMVVGYMHEIGKTVEAFLLTRAYCREVEGIKVLTPQECAAAGGSGLILIGGNESNKREMASNLERLGLTEYFTFSKKVEQEMRKTLFDMIAVRWIENAREDSVQKESKRIGYLTPGYLDTVYAEQRLIINKIKDGEVEYVPIPKEIQYIEQENADDKVLEENKLACEAYYMPQLYKPDVDVIHTFNQVCMTDTAWCASFETAIPRIVSKEKYPVEYERSIDYLGRDNCLGLLALSRNAYDIQNKLLLEHIGSRAQPIIDKTIVLHPPQEVLLEEGEKWRTRKEELTFIFVGRAFFMKGGREMLRVLSRLKQHYQFRLVLISNLTHYDFFTRTSKEERDVYRAMIAHCDWIEHYETLPNDRVLEKCIQADVGLLPSFADTYGYAVLEMQAAGCPVVTTNERAFEEINNEDCGWICKLPVNEDKACDSGNITVLRTILERELERCFVDILEHREWIGAKGRKAVERIKSMHDPKRYAQSLRMVYERGLERV